jgi:hypothetical protein
MSRQWVPGPGLDDTIEHEARNDSDKLRVVFIFDIWHPPHLPERVRSPRLRGHERLRRF